MGKMSPDFEYIMKVPQPLVKPLEARLDENPGKRKNRERYLYVLHVVSRELARAYVDRVSVGKQVSISAWHARLHSVGLKNALGNDYLKVIDDLVRWGFICRGGNYMVGAPGVRGRSKAVWLCFPYASYWYAFCRSRWSKEPFEGDYRIKRGRVRKYRVTSRPFLKRLKAIAAEAKERDLLDGRVALAHEDLPRFTIDREGAKKMLDGMVKSGEMKPSGAKKELVKVERFNRAAKSPTALFVKRDRFGRVHTNMTQMKREIRSGFLYVDGKPTAEVDIKSSQGAFLGAIFRSAADTSACFLPGASAPMNDLRDRCDIRDRAGYLDECDRYDSLLRAGGLYEFFARELSMDFDLDREVDREEAKHAFMMFVFGPVSGGSGKGAEMREAVRRVWTEHFPKLLLAMERMKTGNYAALAREMQRIESDFVFDRVVPRVHRELGIPCCTVHDSLVVEAGMAHRVRAIMDEELATVGVPTMTAEEYGMVMSDAETELHEAEVLAEIMGSDRGTQSAAG